MQEQSLGPADIKALYECLRGALSPDPNLQKGAEETLKALGDRPGFSSCLAVRPLLHAASHLCRGRWHCYDEVIAKRRRS